MEIGQKKASKVMGSLIDIIARNRVLLPLSIVILYFIVFSILYTDVFLSAYNLTSLLLELSVPAIMVVGVSILFISGELDLSIGYNVMFSSMMCSTLVVLGLPVPLAIIITLSITAAVGLTVGLLVTRFKVNSLITTLAAGLCYFGFGQFIYNKAALIKDTCTLMSLPPCFTMLGRCQLIKGLNFQIPIVYSIIIVAIFIYLVGKTKFFSQYYFVGTNYQAAVLSGIKAKELKILAFVICAVLCSFSGIILASRFGSAGTHVGIGMDMQIMTAAVIGGVSFTGGKGTVAGGVTGALFMICLNNGMRIADVPSTVYNIVQGVVLLTAIIVDAAFSKRKVVG